MRRPKYKHGIRGCCCSLRQLLLDFRGVYGFFQEPSNNVYFQEPSNNVYFQEPSSKQLFSLDGSLVQTGQVLLAQDDHLHTLEDAQNLARHVQGQLVTRRKFSL